MLPPAKPVNRLPTPDRAVHVRAPRVAAREVLEADRRHVAAVDDVVRVDDEADDVRRVAVEGRQLDVAVLPALRESELVRVGVLGVQRRIADEDVLDVEVCRERIELLRARAPDAARVAHLQPASMASGCSSGCRSGRGSCSCTGSSVRRARSRGSRTRRAAPPGPRTSRSRGSAPRSPPAPARRTRTRCSECSAPTAHRRGHPSSSGSRDRASARSPCSRSRAWTCRAGRV